MLKFPSSIQYKRIRISEGDKLSRYMQRKLKDHTENGDPNLTVTCTYYICEQQPFRRRRLWPLSASLIHTPYLCAAHSTTKDESGKCKPTTTNRGNQHQLQQPYKQVRVSQTLLSSRGGEKKETWQRGGFISKFRNSNDSKGALHLKGIHLSMLESMYAHT